ncbi:probable ATP-dependent RNA helicase DDX20 [Solea solea]|uniref:probable ATP-dependent RNA helicase DDX20 n=1 Tax=Solea solea TaxID=90069 RepID=UPI00272C7B2C|nr:probable ATP-dependent RNA helicase DDX20 [Solea solea]
MAASVKKAAHDINSRQRTEDVLLSDNIDFASLLLSAAVLDGLSAAGFNKPSPIQLKAIPLGRCGLDLIVQAKSGTGKTCVFSTIALDSLVLENPATQVLVLAPTREIAVQIHSVVMAIGCSMEGLQCHVFIGGRPVSQDKPHLKRCHIAVGSPGRIKQLIELGMLSTSSIRLFVLDEADKLLEEGSFQEQINSIFSSLPVNKQMLALSATYPESLAQYLTRYMREPTFVRLNPGDLGLRGVKQYYRLVQCNASPHRVFEEKVQHLLELFSKIPFNQALVFSNLHTRAQQLADILSSKGLPAACISGGLSQDQRLEAMSKLKQYQCRVLISTDLTSRGIDADKVNLVINLDVPQDWETYMHRIGRAGRFGTQGLAVTYCCHGEEENKMMAIAQKCGLNLSVLPSVMEAGLMDEPCDWDVCTQASTPASFSKVRTEKKKQTKLPAAAAAVSASEVTVEQRPRTLRRGAHGEGDAKNKSVSPTQAALTRQQLQDALPKISALSSFKSRTSTLMTFEEAERDFQTFITTGLGRSVEIVREFRGRDDDGNEERHSEYVTLHDDGSQTVTQPPPVSAPSSSEEEEITADLNHTGGENGATTQLPEPKTSPKSGPEIHHPSSSQSQRREPEPSVRTKTRNNQERRNEPRKSKEESERRQFSEKTSRKPKRDRDDEEEEEEEEEEDEEEEEEWSAEGYWRACYRAWSDYYASMSPFQQRGHHSYYSGAHSWMAAYRMNSVYVEELMKH